MAFSCCRSMRRLMVLRPRRHSQQSKGASPPREGHALAEKFRDKKNKNFRDSFPFGPKVGGKISAPSARPGSRWARGRAPRDHASWIIPILPRACGRPDGGASRANSPAGFGRPRKPAPRPWATRGRQNRQRDPAKNRSRGCPVKIGLWLAGGAASANQRRAFTAAPLGPPRALGGGGGGGGGVFTIP